MIDQIYLAVCSGQVLSFCQVVCFVFVFSGPGALKRGRGRVQMHRGCFLHRICIWKWVKPLDNR